MNDKNENEIIGDEQSIAPESAETATPEKKPSAFCAVFEWIEMIALYFSVAMLILIVFFTHSPVNGSSMYPTLEDKDIVIISKFAYTPKSGDIIVCQSESYGLETPLVKRIIAIEGQTVRIDCENRTITVDGKLLDEDYISNESTPFDASDYLEATFTVPKGKLFVMGDNRGHLQSADSRYEKVGFIDEGYVVGKVVLRLFPLSDIKIF